MIRHGQSLLFVLLVALGCSPAFAQGTDRGYLPPADDGAPRSISPNATYRGGGAPADTGPGYGDPYTPPPPAVDLHRVPADDAYGNYGPPPQPATYSSNEILDAAHHFFGAVSKGLAEVVEYAFRKHGRPNGYILGEEGSGAILAGLRYGEGTLYTKAYG